MKRVAAVALLLVCLHASADEVDDYITARMREMHIPGLALAVCRDGQIVKSRGYGLANIELNVPVGEDTVFELGSITKQFTATAILMLVEEGKIGLDDPLAKHLTGTPATWSAITIRHLLTHASGVQNYLEIPELAEAVHKAPAHDEIANLLFARLRLEFRPGQTWAYSNSGYLLLGNVIEKASGKSYWQFLDERIFKPLGMTSTRSSEPRAVIRKRASGYEWVKNRYENRAALTQNAYAAGAIVSTVRDMAKWDAALHGEMLLKKSTLELMWTPADPAAPFSYGFGWFLDTRRGHRVMMHGGGTPGFSSNITRFPADRITVIVLTNHSDRVLDHMPWEIACFYLECGGNAAAWKAAASLPHSKLETALIGLFAGKPDLSLFTPKMRLFLRTDGGVGLWQWAGSDGQLKSFTFSERDGRVLRYKAVLGEITRRFSFTLDPDGKIEQVYLW